MVQEYSAEAGHSREGDTILKEIKIHCRCGWATTLSDFVLYAGECAGCERVWAIKEYETLMDIMAI